MTIRSMTGYGRAENAREDYTVRVELKSVNNRFLDFQCRASRDLLHLESLLRRELGAYVSRGSVTCQVFYETRTSSGSEIAWNEPLFQTYLHLIRRASEEVGSSARVNIADLLKIPELTTQGRESEGPEAVAERVLPVFRAACEELVRMREREGGTLAKDLESRLAAFYPALDKVGELLPKRQAEFAAKMRDRIPDLVGTSVAEDRLLTEAGLMAEKLDVTEEMVRLRGHLGHFAETLRDHASPGKKLGFLQQEMLREVNTLGNKSQYYDIQQICVGWKEELEIIREQLANLE
jgi:uncharacterized protein (TIGR00255 family)